MKKIGKILSHALLTSAAVNVNIDAYMSAKVGEALAGVVACIACKLGEKVGVASKVKANVVKVVVLGKKAKTIEKDTDLNWSLFEVAVVACEPPADSNTYSGMVVHNVVAKNSDLLFEAMDGPDALPFSINAAVPA